MELSSITYGVIEGGLLTGRFAVKVEVGNPPTSDLSPRDAFATILPFIESHPRPWLVLVDLHHNDCPDVGILMEAFHHHQFTRLLRLRDYTGIPEWLPAQMNNRSLHLRVDITNEPHLRLQAAEVVFHMNTPGLEEPLLPNEPGKAALYVQPGPNVSERDVYEFHKVAKHPWGLIHPPTNKATKTLWRSK